VIQKSVKKNKQNRKDKKLQDFLKRLKSQKLLHVLNIKNDYKIWVKIRIILKKFLQTMINLKATNNYILHKAVQWLELILWWWKKLVCVYIINTNNIIVWNYVHIKTIIRNVLQKLLFDIFNIKYDTILKMLWLHNKNSKINWVNKKLCAIISNAHMRFLNNQRCVYQNISCEITKYHFWLKEKKYSCYTILFSEITITVLSMSTSWLRELFKKLWSQLK